VFSFVRAEMHLVLLFLSEILLFLVIFFVDALDIDILVEGCRHLSLLAGLLQKSLLFELFISYLIKLWIETPNKEATLFVVDGISLVHEIVNQLTGECLIFALFFGFMLHGLQPLQLLKLALGFLLFKLFAFSILLNLILCASTL
jgi:hypothetical protein